MTGGETRPTEARPRVAVFSLGGTIAAPAAADGARISLGAGDIVGALADEAGVQVEAHTFRSLPSASLTVSDLIDLSIATQDALRSGCAGVVVTAGTDTLEEIGFTLDCLHDSSSPVVVTGAMRNAGLPGADGPGNLVGALRVAASPQARDLGCVLVAGDLIHLARFARKSHSSLPSAFDSAGVGPIGWVTEARVRLPLGRRWRRPDIDAHAVRASMSGHGAPRVALHRCALGEEPAVYDALAASALDGVVIEAFGAGHIPERSVPALRRLARAMPVVFASRTGAGDLYRAVGAFPGSERDLLEAGLVPADALDGPKARMLLILLLSTARSIDEIRDAFGEDVSLRNHFQPEKP